MNNILILYDYRGFFATKFIGSSENHKGTTISVKTLEKLFKLEGFQVEVVEFANVNFEKNYSNWYVIYASSEDPGLFYKEYIEDVLLCLKRKGATLIPEFDYFRAHSNKSFQSMIRKSFGNKALWNPTGYSVGHYDEIKLLSKELHYPVVAKVSNGSGSKGVVLAQNEDELLCKSERLMTHVYRDFSMNAVTRIGVFIKRAIRIVTKRRINNETLIKKNRTNKLVVEEFIPELEGDYKVLYFCGKYFVLNRKNRENDFRASGSGRFSFEEDYDSIRNILAFSEEVAKEIDTPLLSLDIGENSTGRYLLEFQCLYFGPYTLQYAPCCFYKESGEWKTIKGPFDLEQEYVSAISRYIHKEE